jgi:hypothetical protein
MTWADGANRAFTGVDGVSTGPDGVLTGRVVYTSVRSSRPIRVIILLTLDRVNLDLPCPR